MAGALGAISFLDAVPAVAAMRWLRVAALPRLSGKGAADHVAMTVDDGPHPDTTPQFLGAFAEADIRATFFLLGERMQRWPGLA